MNIDINKIKEFEELKKEVNVIRKHISERLYNIIHEYTSYRTRPRGGGYQDGIDFTEDTFKLEIRDFENDLFYRLTLPTEIITTEFDYKTYAKELALKDIKEKEDKEAEEKLERDKAQYLKLKEQFDKGGRLK